MDLSEEIYKKQSSILNKLNTLSSQIEENDSNNERKKELIKHLDKIKIDMQSRLLLAEAAVTIKPDKKGETEKALKESLLEIEAAVNSMEIIQNMVLGIKNKKENENKPCLTEIDEYEKANFRKAAVELLQVFMIWLAIGLMNGIDDDDDDKEYLHRLAELQLRRLYTETSVFAPTTGMINEGQRILKSPAASVNTLDNILGLLELVDPRSYTTELKSGRYKGHSRAYRAIDRNMPFKRHINNIVNPELLLPFYKQEH